MDEPENNVLLLLRRIDAYRESLALQQAYNRILEEKIEQIRALVVPIQRPRGGALMIELGWQEWYRANIKDKGFNPLTAAKYTWIYRGQRIAKLEAENASLRGQSLLRKVAEPLPEGCYCAPGKCAAPKPSWCRDFNKRDALLGGGE